VDQTSHKLALLNISWEIDAENLQNVKSLRENVGW